MPLPGLCLCLTVRWQSTPLPGWCCNCWYPGKDASTRILPVPGCTLEEGATTKICLLTVPWRGRNYPDYACTWRYRWRGATTRIIHDPDCLREEDNSTRIMPVPGCTLVPWKSSLLHVLCLYLTVPWKRTGSCGMTAMADRRSASPSLLMARSSSVEKGKQ